MSAPRGAAIATALALLVAARGGGAAGPPPKRIDCKVQPCAEVLPGAVRFDRVAGKPYVVGRDATGKRVGWVALSTDVVGIKGYSGKPLVTLVAITGAGMIAGARVIHHSEPILLVGIPEKRLHEFVGFYAGKPLAAKIAVGASPDPDAITVDVISGATVTVLAENRTILDTGRGVAKAVGVIKAGSRSSGRFIASEERWSWRRMLDEKIFGHLVVSNAEMGDAKNRGAFVDLYFTIADAPQVGRALLGDHEYAWHRKQLKPGEHLVVVLGNGTSSFKGSGFVRGGIFDRVHIEQGLRTLMFTDRDYKNLTRIGGAPDAPSFKEGAVFVARGGKLDPGRPFDLVFLGSRYDGRGGFSRQFKAFRKTLRLPDSLYQRDESDEPSIVAAAWYNARYKVVAVGVILLLVAGSFVARRWLTGDMKRLRRIHNAALLLSAVVLGFALHVQPSVTQVLTLVGTTKTGWRWGLFLSEPQIFVFWIFIAAVTIAWGRGVFCGWTCPYGALSELLFKLGRWLRLPALELPDPLHRWLRKLRYAILFLLVATFLLSPQLGEVMAEVEPFKTTFYVLPWTRPLLLFGWWVVLLAAALVVYRPFCRYLCPLGAALALPSSVRLSGPHRRNFCSDCQICTKGCEPRAIRHDGTIDPRECLSCMECEANYRDETVCPPLVGLMKLAKKRRGGEALSEADEAREQRLLERSRRC